jgi:hypothetical protein
MLYIYSVLVGVIVTNQNLTLNPLCRSVAGRQHLPTPEFFLSRADSGDNLKTQLQTQMTHLLLLLFYLFHYGRTQISVAGPIPLLVVGTIPLLVRSPYLNCWNSDIEDETSTNATVAAVCDHSNLNLFENVCHFLTRNNTKVDWTLGP